MPSGADTQAYVSRVSTLTRAQIVEELADKQREYDNAVSGLNPTPEGYS